MRNIAVFDHTAEAMFGIWGSSLLSSVETWSPYETVLLITTPKVDFVRRPYICLTSSSFVDINPDCEDTEWLRLYVTRLSRRAHINPKFPTSGVYCHLS